MKHLKDIQECDCKYVIDGLMYCGKPIERGSFCKEHASICYLDRKKEDERMMLNHVKNLKEK